MSTGDAHTLEGLREHIGDCHRCALGETRTTLVFGVGDPTADLVFVGEAPGKQEDLQGEPFVGAAGKLLDELLDGIGLTRQQVYIANVLKCRPPNNRDPQAEEIQACTPFLSEQLRLIDPTVVATLGNFATKYLLDTTRGITGLRGKLFHVDGRRIVPVFHPAAALYTPAKKEVLAEDFRRIKAVLDDPSAFQPTAHTGAAAAGSEAADEFELPAPEPPTPPREPTPPADDLTLF